MAGRKTGGPGGVRPGAGRKPLPPAERQRNRVVVNLTDAEYDALAKAAGSASPSAFLRALLLRSLSRRRNE